MTRRRLINRTHDSEAPPSGWKQLLRYARPHSATLWVGVILNTIAGILTLAQPMVAKYFIDGLATGESVTGLALLLGILLLVATSIAALGYYLIERSAEQVVYTVRTGMVSRILRLRLGALNRTSPGDLISRVVSDSNQLRMAATSNLVDLWIGSFQLLGIIFFMAYLDLPLFGVVLAVVLLIGAAFTTLLPRIKKANILVQQALGRMAEILERSIIALRTVKASGAEDREIRSVNAAAGDAKKQGIRAAVWSSFGGISSGLVVQTSFLIVLGFGGARVASGALEASSLIAFLLFLFYLSGPISQLSGSISGLQIGLAAMRRIQEIHALEIEPSKNSDEHESHVPPTDENSAAELSFDKVSFGYLPEGPTVLNDMSFNVPAGGMTAIVGPSGAGKSTIFSLIESFYEIDSGKIFLDGRDIQEWPLEKLRNSIGYVEQEAPVLSGTLKDNLLMAAPDATDVQLDEVVRRAQLESLVNRLELGIDTPVGHQGITLSGGERQRISLARALLRKPRLLLLDEATSQLDSLNEHALQKVISESAMETTVMVIAHRISTVRKADRILVIQDGHIRSSGTHEKLMKTDQLYRDLSRHQLITDSSQQEQDYPEGDVVLSSER